MNPQRFGGRGLLSGPIGGVGAGQVSPQGVPQWTPPQNQGGMYGGGESGKYGPGMNGGMFGANKGVGMEGGMYGGTPPGGMTGSIPVFNGTKAPGGVPGYGHAPSYGGPNQSGPFAPDKGTGYGMNRMGMSGGMYGGIGGGFGGAGIGGGFGQPSPSAGMGFGQLGAGLGGAMGGFGGGGQGPIGPVSSGMVRGGGSFW